jgi:myo-inositol-1(or 4)-monophosphatase
VTPEFEREIAVARELAVQAGARIAEHAARDRSSWDKADDHPVTQADLEANALIGAGLARAFPGDGLLSEETADSPERTRAERVWIVDPLDGTKEFIENVPEYAVSIALALAGQPVVGVVYQPLTRECFWAVRGAGAWLGERRLHVSARAQLADAVVLTSRTEMRRGQVERFRAAVGELRPIGSVAFKLALVAAARGDAWLSMAGKSEWDVCAGHLLVREAGGVFTNLLLTGEERDYNRSDVLLQPPMAAGPAPLVAALARLGKEP